MSDFVIKTDVPMPARGGWTRELKYPWLQLPIKGCFDVAIKDVKAIPSLQASLYTCAKRKLVKITIRRVDSETGAIAPNTGDVLRVWRVA